MVNIIHELGFVVTVTNVLITGGAPARIQIYLVSLPLYVHCTVIVYTVYIYNIHHLTLYKVVVYSLVIPVVGGY
jgi:hypothetical protein